MDKLLEEGITIEELEKEVAELDKQYKADREAGKITSSDSESGFSRYFRKRTLKTWTLQKKQ